MEYVDIYSHPVSKRNPVSEHILEISMVACPCALGKFIGHRLLRASMKLSGHASMSVMSGRLDLYNYCIICEKVRFCKTKRRKMEAPKVLMDPYGTSCSLCILCGHHNGGLTTISRDWKGSFQPQPVQLRIPNRLPGAGWENGMARWPDGPKAQRSQPFPPSLVFAPSNAAKSHKIGTDFSRRHPERLSMTLNDF